MSCLVPDICHRMYHRYLSYRQKMRGLTINAHVYVVRPEIDDKIQLSLVESYLSNQLMDGENHHLFLVLKDQSQKNFKQWMSYFPSKHYFRKRIHFIRDILLESDDYLSAINYFRRLPTGYSSQINLYVYLIFPNFDWSDQYLQLFTNFNFEYQKLKKHPQSELPNVRQYYFLQARRNQHHKTYWHFYPLFLEDNLTYH